MVIQTQEAFFAVHGVSYSDGTVWRQEAVRAVVEGQELYAVPDTENAFDNTAIKIFAEKELRHPLGFVLRDYPGREPGGQLEFPVRHSYGEGQFRQYGSD